MHKKQFSKESELADCYIGAPGCLEPFNAADSNTNMRRLNHRNIVGTITNSE